MSGDNPFTVIAPGAVAVDDLKSAHVILDHGINCVIVRRPAWIEQHQDSIAEALRKSYRRAVKVQTHAVWNGQEGDHGQCVADRLGGHFGVTGREFISTPALATLVGDILAQVAVLRELSGAQKIYLNSRLLERVPEVDAPVKHADDQFLTISCAYLGGGTVCQFYDGTEMQLAAGEVGFWKGMVGPQENMRVTETVNKLQPLVHWTPINPADYPRFVSLIDAYDSELPERMRTLGSFAAWK